MTREEAKNYLKSSGMSDEQIKTVIDAFCISRKEKIISDLKKYECDCRLSQDDDIICKRCNDNLFQTIYKIIERNFDHDKGSTV